MILKWFLLGVLACLNKKVKKPCHLKDERNERNGLHNEEISGINFELVSILEKGHSKLAKLLAKTGLHFNEVNCKERLQNFYKDYHIALKQEEYLKHVHDVTTDLSMIELAIDEAWDMEMSFHKSCQRAAINCLRKNIGDENLFVWTLHHLSFERGLSFEIQKICQKYYSGMKKSVDWKSSMITLVLEIWCIFQTYFDMFQDLLFSLMLYHVSNNLLVRYIL